MRFKQFCMKIIETGETVLKEFDHHHYKQVGVGYSPQSGMPLLESYQLVNYWNASQIEPRFIYWLN